MNEPNFFQYNRRWYDEIGNMALAIHQSRKLPVELQLIIAHNLNEAIDEQRALRHKEKHAYSMGVNRTLGLYKATKRQRWYDPNANLHRSFTLMSSIPIDLLADYAERMLDVNEFYQGRKGTKMRPVEVHSLAETVHAIMQKTLTQPVLAEDRQSKEGMSVEVPAQYQIPGHHIIIHNSKPRSGP